MRFDYHVHGLWILGSILFFFASLIAGNVEWVAGTTETSFAISIILSFVFYLLAGMFWISSAVNAREPE